MVSFAQAVEHYASLLGGLTSACRMLLDVGGSWEQLKLALASFSAQPNSPILRAVTHLLIAKPLLPGAAGPSPPPGTGVNGAAGKKGGKPAEVPPWCPSQVGGATIAV